MTISPAPSGRPFADAVADYALAGWSCILPVPPATKTPPPEGYTGAEGADTEPTVLVDWAGRLGHYSIALRMPAFTGPGGQAWTVIGIDVDDYEKTSELPDGSTRVVRKQGAATIAAHLERWGPLPPTWSSTARGAGASRISFYRAPLQRYGTRLVAGAGDTQTSDVEIIQRHHRYAVVAPSVNPAAGGARYAWYDPAGALSAAPPRPGDLPALPQAWIDGLARLAAAPSAAAADAASGQALLDQLGDDWRPECAEITSARQVAGDLLRRAESGSRHDAMTGRVHQLVQLAAHGHTGVAAAFAELRQLWTDLTAGEDRGEEFERALLTSARKAVTVVGAVQVPRDPCLFAVGVPLPVPAPGDPGGDPDDPNVVARQIFAPPRWLSVREVIGAHAFDPNAGLDQTLAEAVLERTAPALRYAYDADGWLLRVPDRWELHKRLSPWAVAEVAKLTPVGDPTAEKGSEQHERHKRRTRLMGTAGARAVAGKMDDLVAGGMHPGAVALAKLDTEPHVLWAGGVAWDLRLSGEQPMPADIDPAMPHLHAAAVSPDPRPTPLWDAFLEAVWPDESTRAWALRVLAIALTGYADRALPILIGDTGRGKTQVVHLIMSVLGTYAHAADPRLMSEAGEKAHASIVYALKGRRLSFIDEGPREGRWAQERLKQLTGGGELTANEMHQNPITFTPTHTLVLTTNDEPILTDPAVRSRARLVPCDGDPELVRSSRASIGHVSGHTWRQEAPGVLAQLMREAALWLGDPTSAMPAAAPEHIRYLAETIGAEQDPVTVWLAEETDPSERGTPSRELYQAFVASCRRNSMDRSLIPSETKWGKALTRLGYPSLHTRQGKIRRLIVRTGGLLPGSGSVPAVDAAEERDGLHGSRDGFVTGSDPQPVTEFPQVNPSVSVDCDGCDGLNDPLSHMRAHAHTRDGQGEVCSNPPHDPSADHPSSGGKAPLNCEDASREDRDGFIEAPEAAPEGLTEPSTPPKRKRTGWSEEASAAAAEAKRTKRAAAVLEAGGTLHTLPAALDRGGQITEITPAEAARMLATFAHQPLTVDVETTGFPVGHRDYALRTVQLGGAELAVVLDPADADQADVARAALAAAPVLHAHSATADLIPLQEAGLLEHGLDEAWSRMVDTVILAKLADPASTGSDPGLKQLADFVLEDQAVSQNADKARSELFRIGKWLTDTKVTTPAERSGWAQVDPRCATMIRYAGADVLDDAAIAERLPRPTPAVLERERTAQRMTARVAHHGLRIDGVHVERQLEHHRAEHRKHAAIVRAFGIDNPGSGPQVAAALERLGAALPRTATGRPSVAESVLTGLRAADGPSGDLARAVLDTRHHATAIGTFLEPYHQLATTGDGRARPTVYTLAADTGRMSCVRPNLQQVPREGGFRACLTADPGELLISADFSGVELRVAAALSGDRTLRSILAEGRDLHLEVARLAFGPNATKADRYAVKRGVFGRIYGGGVGAISRGVGVSEAVAQQIIDALDAMLPELSEWSRMTRDAVQSGRTQFPTYSGRVVHLDRKSPHKAPNYCIQGTARELLVDALVRWSSTKWGNAVLLPFHDELVVKVPEDQAHEATATLAEVMSSDLFGVLITSETSEPSYAWSDSV